MVGAGFAPRTHRRRGHLTAIVQLALALLWILVPGYACVAWARPKGTGRALRLGTALALGPPIGGAVIAVLMLAHVSTWVAAVVLLVLGLLSLVASRLRRERAPAPAEPRAAWWIAGVFALGTLLFPILSEWWRIYSDNWAHAGIVRAIEVGGVPPLDPGFAGVKLHYAWIYHAFVAGAHALIGIDRFAMMVLLEATALVATTLCVAGAIGNSRGSTVTWTLLLLLLGLNALFPLFAPLLVVRAFLGEVRGMSELARQFDLMPLEWDKTGVFLQSLGGQGFFLDKFMVVTPFALALAAFAGWIASFKRWLDGGGRSELGLGGLLTLAAGLMHPVVGVFLGASAILALALSFARNDTGARARLLPWSVAVVIGLVPVVLYTATVLGGSGGTHRELPVDLAPLKLLGYVSCLALGLWFAARPLWRMARGEGAQRAWALWVLAGCAVALVSRLPGGSPFFTVDKLSYLVWIPLTLVAGPAFASFMETRSTPARIAIALLLFVPVNGLALVSRIADPHNRAQQPFGLAGFAYLRERTQLDAVLLVQLGDWESSGFGKRDQYYSLGSGATQLGYDLNEIAARAELEEHLFRAGTLRPEDRARLAGLHRPVYIVWADFRDPMWRYTPGTIARREAPPGPKPTFDPGLPVVFDSPELEVRAVPLPSRR